MSTDPWWIDSHKLLFIVSMVVGMGKNTNC